MSQANIGSEYSERVVDEWTFHQVNRDTEIAGEIPSVC